MNALTHSFDPSIENDAAFRAALGQFGTGVTVVTCQTQTGPIGITANSFASVSLDPPLVLWAPAKASARYPFFMEAEHFAIHVIGAEQAHLGKAFAREGDAFHDCDWSYGDRDVPLLGGCLSRFECTRTAAHDGGDHSIIVARVRRVTTNKGTPLIFFGGQFGGFTEPH
ncbi:flavin reductase family protein [Marivita sp. GX14005]|uniref:flavin reductase family protein n=1 Tax=Marivita sp. GX14005 TaxID=2942276 RepID=UPI002018453A|nr:flavin reductase family protein [Marivita sp. GX14005]MCL3882212.1 flavin reductase family protein [Marivita sp. GX14005]